MYFLYWSKRPLEENINSINISFTNHALISGNRRDSCENFDEILILQTKIVSKTTFKAY